jgi:hypothetical protein
MFWSIKLDAVPTRWRAGSTGACSHEFVREHISVTPSGK